MKKLAVALVALAAALWYLRDPAWLANESSGLRPWQQEASSGLKYRWSGAHASFFVPADATAIHIPVSTSFGDDKRPMLVTATVDDGPPTRIVLRDEGWYSLAVPLPPRGSRRVRRIDLRTNITRADNRGVKVGEVEVIRVPVAAGLLENSGGGAHSS